MYGEIKGDGPVVYCEESSFAIEVCFDGGIGGWCGMELLELS